MMVLMMILAAAQSGARRHAQDCCHADWQKPAGTKALLAQLSKKCSNTTCPLQSAKKKTLLVGHFDRQKKRMATRNRLEESRHWPEQGAPYPC